MEWEINMSGRIERELGRIVLPLIFYDDDGKEVSVNEYSQLKKYFNNKHITALKAYLNDGKLQQFFYGNGKDELRDLIIELKEKGENEISILNSIAERIGVEKLKEPEDDNQNLIYESKKFFDLFNSSKCKELRLLINDLEMLDEELKLRDTKKIIGLGLNRILIKKVTITNETPHNELVLENMSIVPIFSEKEVKEDFYQENAKLVIKNCKITFKKVEFYGVDIYLVNSKALFIECNIEKGLIDSSHSELFFSNVNFKEKLISSDSLLNIENSKFSDRFSGLILQNSNFKMNKVTSENILAEIGIFANNSKGEIVNSRIYGNLSGIRSINSSIMIKNSTVSRCKAYAIISEEKSNIEILESEIFNNSKESEDYSQILVKNSSIKLIKSKIFRGFGSGITALDSHINLEETEIKENSLFGVLIKKSRFEIINSRLEKNVAIKRGIPQLLFDSSAGRVFNTKICYNPGEGIRCRNSNLTMESSEIFENQRYGVIITENSKCKITKSDFYKNGTQGENYSQLFSEYSDIELSNSSVYQGCGKGVYSENSVIIIRNTKIYENLKEGLWIVGSTNAEIYNLEICKNGNELECNAQIFLQKSKAKISDSNINRGYGDGIICIRSDVVIQKTLIHKNFKKALSNINSRIHLSEVHTRENQEGCFKLPDSDIICDSKCRFSEKK